MQVMIEESTSERLSIIDDQIDNDPVITAAKALMIVKITDVVMLAVAARFFNFALFDDVKNFLHVFMINRQSFIAKIFCGRFQMRIAVVLIKLVNNV